MSREKKLKIIRICLWILAGLIIGVGVFLCIYGAIPKDAPKDDGICHGDNCTVGLDMLLLSLFKHL